MHLARMNRDLDEFKPTTTVIDPISAFRGSDSEVHSCLLRMVDILKTKGITAVMTRLSAEVENIAGGDQGIPSLIDTWVSLGALEANGERNRGLYVLKSRGMSHSNQIREYQITNGGIRLLDVYRSSWPRSIRPNWQKHGPPVPPSNRRMASMRRKCVADRSRKESPDD